jgi:hypothetical protein
LPFIGAGTCASSGGSFVFGVESSVAQIRTGPYFSASMATCVAAFPDMRGFSVFSVMKDIDPCCSSGLAGAIRAVIKIVYCSQSALNHVASVAHGEHWLPIAF